MHIGKIDSLQEFSLVPSSVQKIWLHPF